MIIKKRQLLFVLCCCLSLSNAVTADDAVEFITLGLVDFPPSSYFDESKQECLGYSVTTTRQLFAHYDIEVKAICAPAARVFRMMRNVDIDLTINVSTTKLLQDTVDFFETPFSELQIIFLSHNTKGFEGMVSGIRGFDYQRNRDILEKRGYFFQDNPGSIAAIKVFVKGRTRHLITYRRPFEHYLERNDIEMPEDFDLQVLGTVPSYYSISKQSSKRDRILEVLNHYVKKTQIKRFLETTPINKNQ